MYDIILYNMSYYIISYYLMKAVRPRPGAEPRLRRGAREVRPRGEGARGRAGGGVFAFFRGSIYFCKTNNNIKTTQTNKQTKRRRRRQQTTNSGGRGLGRRRRPRPRAPGPASPA